MKEQTGAEILIHAADAPLLLSARGNLSTWILGGITSPPADRLLTDGDTLVCGETVFRVLSTPGHTPGSISLVTPGLAFTGDALFKESIGRTDFPGGSLIDLLTGIRENLFTLPEDTVVYPGLVSHYHWSHEQLYNTFFNKDN